jgi:site-specific recombinase XerD
MLEELRLRNYSPNTIEVYLRCVANFARHFRVSPDRLGPEHIRQYQLFLVERKKVSWAVFNQTVCALRFFYHHTLHRDWMIEHIQIGNEEAGESAGKQIHYGRRRLRGRADDRVQYRPK